jgi:hypothetical protein
MFKTAILVIGLLLIYAVVTTMDHYTDEAACVERGGIYVKVDEGYACL